MSIEKEQHSSDAVNGRIEPQLEKVSDFHLSSSSSQSDAPRAPAISYEAKENLPGWKVFVIWLAVSFGVLCTFLDEGIIATAIPRITDQFGSLKDVGWYGSAYQMTLCAFQLIYGRLYNQFNIKTVFLASLLIFEVGSLVCAVSPSSSVFIVGRAIAGLGASGLQSGSLVLISAALPAKKLPLYLGAIGMVYGVAAVLGPVVGGIITNSHLTWRWRFGGTLYSWNDGRTISCFVVAAVLIVAFVVEQWWMGEKALVPPRLAKMRVVIFGSFFGFCLDSAFFTLVYYVPLWFQAIQSVSPEQSGVRYLALCLAFIFTIFLSGWGVTKTGYYQPFMLAGTVLISAGSGLLSTLRVGSTAGHWISYQVIAGLGIGASTQQAAVAVQSTLTEGDVAIGVAVVLFFQCLGPTTAITISQAVFASDLASGISTKLPDVDMQQIKDAGATQLTGLVSEQQAGILLDVYNHAVTRTFIVAAAMAAASVIGVVGIGLKKIRVEESVADPDVADSP
ncbi:major facilitator superfamily transporter [Colletotrichum karsti]|uniref:Major facilitator superfamily transporter n=1 Tax=Colletotrichum karsti TaxID=1095194 RepID=A0A9P6I5U1_9PEZI|nr:major facilitator superfamily transporter [Colletotrichum karsti]KAF9876380.1 major facilitator superfamily transporter [Colletotrichum karsti]